MFDHDAIAAQLDDQVILITGGTGSLGQRLTEIILRDYHPRKLIIFSRDELKQFEMRQRFSERAHPCLRYFIGDVRDKDRLLRAFDGVDVVVHAAALKQVPSCESNPLEAVKTNILGAANVIDAAIDRDVGRVIALSSDKAASPCNLYGATKLCADKLFTAAHHYVGYHRTRFAVVRYGNVVGSRGSVVPLFQKLRSTGVLPITDPRMTRFWLTIDQGVEFVLRSLTRTHGGETFVPKIPSMNLLDLARAIGPDCRYETVGIRPGEKLHEVLLTEDDARQALEYEDYYALLPHCEPVDYQCFMLQTGGRPLPEGFRFSSDANSDWLSVEDLRQLLQFSEARLVA
ncbi:MAG: UDP-N-acetylglucosamine 4,6-dehydratase (inverting) [Pirellulales bacterium]